MATRILRQAPLALLGIALLALLVARARLVTTVNVNWDEFHFLALVHEYLRGELAARLLTFHVHFFGWVTSTSTNEVDQVLALRWVMLALACVSAGCAAFIGWRLTRSAAGAAFAVVAGQSVAYVLHHGSAARYDALVAPLFFVAAALLVGARGPRRAGAVGAAGVVFAVALLVSIKAALLAPALGGLLLARALDDDADARHVGRELAWFATCCAIAGGLLFAVHALSLAEGATSAAGGGLLPIVQRMFPGNFLPNHEPLLLTLRWDTAFWLLVAAGGALAFVDIGRGGAARADAVRLLCFALPVGAVALYQNAYAYFYAGTAPAAALLTALVVARLEGALRRRPALLLPAIALLVAPLAQATRGFLTHNSDDLVTPQRRVVAAVHEVFPEPVPYVDRCSMIGAYPKVGLFMTTWSLADYRRAKVPVLAKALAAEQPHFLLNNIGTLDLSRPYGGKRNHRLLKKDFAALKASFIPHWGPLWVAGTSLALTAGEPRAFDLRIAGAYAVELDGDGAVLLDGRPARQGDVVELAAGRHAALADAGAALTLRIATARPPPREPPPDGRLFTGLSFRAPK